MHFHAPSGIRTYDLFITAVYDCMYCRRYGIQTCQAKEDEMDIPMNA
jgi:hypothetical protein